MDESKFQLHQLYANTAGQPLDLHLFAVGYVAHSIVYKLIGGKKIAESAFLAGCFHDIGKIDPQFQQWLSPKLAKDVDRPPPEDGVHIDKGKFSFEHHPRHNEISTMLYALLIDGDRLNKCQRKSHIPHAIYWHHTRPYRKVNYKSLRDIYTKFSSSLNDEKIGHQFDIAHALLAQVARLSSDYEDETPAFSSVNKQCDVARLDDFILPPYKVYSEVNDELAQYETEVTANAVNNLIRAAVISADRAVSALSAETLQHHFESASLNETIGDIFTAESTLTKNIESCLKGFSDNSAYPKRNQQQREVVGKLVEIKRRAAINEETNLAVLQGPAGCGKSKVVLEWASKTEAIKIWWICPRVQVCLGLFEELRKEQYLPQSQIEIFTGEYKQTAKDGLITTTSESAYFSGDVIITTIDQAVNAVISHGQVTALVELMNAHVVFDEFHELLLMPAFNLLFAELIKCKNMRDSKADTLLVSATPNYLFLEKVLGIQASSCVSVASFNTAKYKIQFDVYDESSGNQNPLLNQAYSGNTFVITNTARDAQIGFIQHLSQENAILLHSKYTKTDKRYWFERVMRCFEQNGTREFDVLRSGPIVQASLNINCAKMLTEFTTAENWLQRLGRLDRFCENAEPNEYITVLAQSIANGKQTTNTARFLNHQFSWHSAQAWYHFLIEKLGDRKVIQLSDLYEIYDAFYQDNTSRGQLEKDIKAALTNSAQFIYRQVIDPIFVPIKKRKIESQIKIRKHSLRGNNRFVQLAICSVSNEGGRSFPNQYAYAETTDHTQVDDSLTASVDEITGYGDSDKDLLAFMNAKHHNIKAGAKKAFKDRHLLELARSPETPIYLSYTPEDLKKIGGAAKQSAIYYAISQKQPIGSISLNNLTTEVKQYGKNYRN